MHQSSLEEEELNYHLSSDPSNFAPSDNYNLQQQQRRSYRSASNAMPMLTPSQLESLNAHPSLKLSDENGAKIAMSIFELGLKYASPKIILALIASNDRKNLDQERVKSHLQKFRPKSKEEFTKQYHETIAPQFAIFRKRKVLDEIIAMEKQVSRARVKLLKLLIVDDSKMIRKIVSKVIGSLGHTCDEADSGVEGVEMMQRAIQAGANYDVVLMDNNMPMMMGVDATRIMREQLGFKGIILGVTGYDIQDDISKFLAHGADQVVMKPMTKEKFETIIGNITK